MVSARVAKTAAATAAALLAAGASSAPSPPSSSSPPSLLVVNTTSGRYAPHPDPRHPDVAAFLDIPYAEPPTGDLRFARPVPKSYHREKEEEEEGQREPPVTTATSLPPACLQYLNPSLRGSATAPGGPVTGFNLRDPGRTDEDCLRLTVYAPRGAVERAQDEGGRYDEDGSEDDSAPAGTASALLPVIVWLHGGGWSFGGTDIPYQLAPAWVQRAGGRHVVVQVQYRLNLLGMPAAAGLTAADEAGDGDGGDKKQQQQKKKQQVNLFALDQLLALEWVRDNVASFGGDPGRVTLWGQSAGAYSSDGYLFSSAANANAAAATTSQSHSTKEDGGKKKDGGEKKTKQQQPLVRAVIANSGNAVDLGALLSASPDGSGNRPNHTTFSAAARDLGCAASSTSSDWPEEELRCMRRVPTSLLRRYLQSAPGGGSPSSTTTTASDAGLVFNVFADNETVFPGDTYQQRLLLAASQSGSGSSRRDGAAVAALLAPAHVPLLIGSNTNEGAAVVPASFPGSLTATSLPDDLQAVAEFFAADKRCSTLRDVQLRAAAGAPTWQYLYAGNFSDVSPLPWMGAYHSAELPMIFGTDNSTGDEAVLETAVSEAMQDRWLQFITDPEGGLTAAGWPPASAGPLDRSKLALFAADGKAEQIVDVGADRVASCAGTGFNL